MEYEDGPHQNFTEIIHRIRSRWSFPILIASGAREEEIRNFNGHFGRIDIQAKPFLPHQIVSRMQRLLQEVSDVSGE